MLYTLFSCLKGAKSEPVGHLRLGRDPVGPTWVQVWSIFLRGEPISLGENREPVVRLVTYAHGTSKMDRAQKAEAEKKTYQAQ